jgi:hypothetical protein
MVGNFGDIISRLKTQKSAIERAIDILREFDEDAPAAQRTAKTTAPKKIAFEVSMCPAAVRTTRRSGMCSQSKWNSFPGD